MVPVPSHTENTYINMISKSVKARLRDSHCGDLSGISRSLLGPAKDPDFRKRRRSDLRVVRQKKEDDDDENDGHYDEMGDAHPVQASTGWQCRKPRA